MSSLQKRFALRQSGNRDQNNSNDRRPMTLRHQVSLILRFGWPVGRDQRRALILDALALRHRLLAVLLLSVVWQP
jgi:hypothetical protein